MGCLDENTIAEFVEHRLPAEQSAAVEDHVDTCPDCRTLVAIVAQASGVSAKKEAIPAGTLRLEAIAKGTRVGRYIILSRFPAGTMGVVYAAYDPTLDRKVAIKFVRPWGDGDHAARLLREARAMARLAHPNVVRVFDVDELDGALFLAMELLDGGTMGEWLRAGAHPWTEVLDRFLLAGRGLEAAHREGLVHRDFKPDNVLLGTGGRVCVTDFGLVRAVVADVRGAEDSGITPKGNPLDLSTAAGMLVGTPAYMAPEQLEGGAATAASDQYAFCVALFEGLFGERPVASRNGASRLPAMPSASKVPSWLKAAVLRGLQASPADRHPSMAALLRALASRRRRGRTIWAALGVAALLTAQVAWAAHERYAPTPCSGMERELAGIWDEARRTQVRASFVATGVPYVDVALTHIDSALDGYAARWVASRSSVCIATATRHEAPDQAIVLRGGCLEKRLHAFQDLVDVLAHADAATVEHAAEAVQSLASVESCDDASLLALRIRPPTPDLASRVAELDRQRARVTILVATGRDAEACAVGTSLVRDARELGYRPLLGEAMVALGTAEERCPTDEDSAATIFAGVGHAEASGDDETAALGWTLLVRDHVMAEVDLAAGKRALDRAHAAIDRLGTNLALTDLLADNEAFLLLATGDAHAALDMTRAHVRDLDHRLGANPLALAQALSDFALALRYTNGCREATLASLQASSLVARELGDEHPRTAQTLAELGFDQLCVEDLPAAKATLEHAGATYEKLFGPDDIVGGRVLIALGETLDRLGDSAGGEALLQRALSIYAPHFTIHPTMALVHGAFAELYLRHGRLAEAEASAQKAIRVWEHLPGAAPYELVRVLTVAGEADVGLTKYADATPLLERALHIYDEMRVPASLGRARVAFALAEALRGSRVSGSRVEDLARAAQTTFAGADGHKDDADRVQAFLRAAPQK